MSKALSKLLRQVCGCKGCVAHLPPGPRPTVNCKASVKIVILGQARETKVHGADFHWNDASGRWLCDKLDLDDDTFYDEDRIAIVRMGFYYPGANPKGGDNPPRPECALP